MTAGRRASCADHPSLPVAAEREENSILRREPDPGHPRRRRPVRSAGLAHRLRRTLVAFVLATGAAAEPRAVELPAPGREGWQPVTFPRVERVTRYEATQQDEFAAVRATSACSASALLLPLEHVDLARTPLLRWRWRVDEAFDVPDAQVKAGDDFPARVYLLFELDVRRASLVERARHALGTRLFGQGLPGNALNYVWTRGVPPGATWDNPFTAASKMVSRGSAPLGQWHEEEADVVADHRALFGVEPTRLVGVALMTDTDNSCQQAQASYADFRFAERAASREPAGATSEGGLPVATEPR